MRGSWVALAAIAVISTTAHADKPDAPFPNLARPALVKSVTATSTYKDPHDAYAAWKAVQPEIHVNENATSPDDAAILWTAWCEGKPDEGIGETLTIEFAEPTLLDTVTISAGVWRTDALFAANNQPTSLAVGFDDKTVTVSPSGKKPVDAKIPGGKAAKVSKVTVKILAVKKGKMNDSCIANIDLSHDGTPWATAIGIDTAAWAALPAAVNAMQTAMSGDKRAGLDKVVEFPFTSSNPVGDYGGFGGTKRVSVASWSELVAACKRYDAARAKDGATYVDPRGCPNPANYDPNDDRTNVVKTYAPGVIALDFPGHNDSVVQWLLHWTGKEWRVRATIDDPVLMMM